jgi:hypothetical protein
MARSDVIRQIAATAGASRSNPQERPGNTVVLSWIDDADCLVVQTADGRIRHIATEESQAAQMAKLERLMKNARGEDQTHG